MANTLQAAMPAIRALIAAQRDIAERMGAPQKQGAPLGVDPVAVAVVTPVARPFVEQTLRERRAAQAPSPLLKRSLHPFCPQQKSPQPAGHFTLYLQGKAMLHVLKLSCFHTAHLTHHIKTRACSHDSLGTDLDAVFQDARQRVEEWLQDAGVAGHRDIGCTYEHTRRRFVGAVSAALMLACTATYAGMCE